MTWRWVGVDVTLAIHDRQLAEHGGLDGVRDRGAVESALARPQNLAAYGEPDAADLAAAYAYGIARNHGFADGNKRTAWVVARLFLADNHYTLTFDPPDAIRTMEGVAGGAIDEVQLAQWFRDRIIPPDIKLIHEPSWNPEAMGYVTLLVQIGRRELVVVLTRGMLDDVFGVGEVQNPATTFVRVARQHLAQILATAVAVADDPKRIPPDGRLHLRAQDFKG
jgi:death-on-curing protein